MSTPNPKGRGTGESKTSPRKIKAVERQAQALELRKAGVTYAQIAKTLGYKSPSGAQQAIETAMQNTVQEPADTLRRLECERLDAMWRGLWALAVRGDAVAIARCLDIMARRAKLLGLDAPVKQELSGDTSLRVEYVNDWRGTVATTPPGADAGTPTGEANEYSQCRPQMAEDDARDGDSG